MLTAQQNFLLIQEIEANRRFLLMAYQQNPPLLVGAEARIKQLFDATFPLKKELYHGVPAKQRGISLVELIMFIVIVSVALTGVLLVFNQNTKHSADPLIRKQALAVAQSMMEEVQLHNFANPTGGFTGAKTQANRALFDDIFDYHGFAPGGVFPADGTATTIAGLGSYSVTVSVTATALGAIAPASAARITVTVTGPNSETIVLDGFRTDY
jgi:MSHA pilin protein MshD